jgi:DNA ligase-1
MDEKSLRNMPEVVIVQPKLNGERCKAEWRFDLGHHVLLTSTAREFKGLSHIVYELRDLYPGSDVDGELYFHGWSRERIHSVASRRISPHPESGLLQYHVFDLDSPMIKQKYRITAIQNGQHAVRAVTHACCSKEDISKWAYDFVGRGYEGIIIRHPDAYYEEKRSKFMLKFKPTKTDRYIIVGVQQEVDKYGDPKNSLGAIKVRDREGNEFFVGSGAALTKSAREQLWLRRDMLPGRFARVKHSIILTNGGFPTCTSLVEIEI